MYRRPDLLEELKQLDNQELNYLVYRLYHHPFDSFEPRSDDPINGDEQESFFDSNKFITVALGGNGCLGAEQEIYDPSTNTSTPIGEIAKPFHVTSYSGREFRTSPALAPWVKGVDRLYRVHLSNGFSFVSTLGHRVLGSDGEYYTVETAHRRKIDLQYTPLSQMLCTVDRLEYLRTDEFYDFHVPGDNNYALAGAVHHNSGKTYVAAQKVVEFLRTTPPPKPDTPFWVIGDTYDESCGSCWHQKLREIIPHEWLEPDRITWLNQKRHWPYSVPLMPQEPNSPNNWVLEFKSYEQGRHRMQSIAIGGAWFTEQFPWDLFEEVLRGCREWSFPGSVILEQTPVDPEKSVRLQEVYQAWCAGDDRYKSWAFHHFNTQSALDTGHVTDEWFQSFYGAVSDEMRETRLRGIFATYEGVIYQAFRPALHLVDHLEIPPYCFQFRTIDWGSSEEHPFRCLWAARDSLGDWYVYDEYHSSDQRLLWADHIRAIKDRHDWDQNSPYYLNTYADPSRPDLIREFSNGGIPITAANNAVYDGIESVRRALAIRPATGTPGLVIDRVRCPYLAREIQTYRWMHSTGKGVNPVDARPIPLKRNDHSADALRYLIHSATAGLGAKVHTMLVRRAGNSVRYQRDDDLRHGRR